MVGCFLSVWCIPLSSFFSFHGFFFLSKSCNCAISSKKLTNETSSYFITFVCTLYSILFPIFIANINQNSKKQYTRITSNITNKRDNKDNELRYISQGIQQAINHFTLQIFLNLILILGRQYRGVIFSTFFSTMDVCFANYKLFRNHFLLIYNQCIISYLIKFLSYL